MLIFFQTVPHSEEDKKAKLLLCSKYLETFNQIKEREKGFVDLSIDLLIGMSDLLQTNSAVCFLLICFVSNHKLFYLLTCI